MASINFTGLQKIELTPDKYTYSDLHLDFNNPIKKDLDNDYDGTAIKNSIFALFNTIPGQNLLNPLYGLNLTQYLFEPISEINGQSIGEAILTGISIYEPRVVVKGIDIQVNETEQTYYITLNISMPFLNNNVVRIPGTLSKTGYIFS